MRRLVSHLQSLALGAFAASEFTNSQRQLQGLERPARSWPSLRVRYQTGCLHGTKYL